MINDSYQFYYTKTFSKNEEKESHIGKKDIYFSPVGNSVLLNGEVKYLFAGKYLYKIEGLYKEILAQASNLTLVNYSKLFVGLKLDPLIDLLDGVNLYFSFKNPQSEERFYNSLHSAKWKINGKEVIFRKGLKPEINKENSLLELIKKENDISYKTSCNITDFHNKNFMTLLNGNYHQRDFTLDGDQIQFFQEHFANQKLNFSQNEILWIEIDFAAPMFPDEIADIGISMNCFPVINRKLNEYTHSIVKGVNIIPVITDDLFFDIKRITDSKDTVYLPEAAIQSISDSQFTYLLRQGGIARFDSRNAREAIKHLIDLVRDEAAAFAVKGTELISFELKQLDQIISRLQQRINASEVVNDLNSYLILESNTNYDKIHVQFWSYDGDTANSIRSGTKLSVYRETDIDDKSVLLLTQSFGGREKLTKEDKLNALRRTLLSNGRIVTTEDIKALCFELFGSQIKTAKVKKGVRIESTPGKGLSRTLDVYVYLNEGEKLTEEEMWYKTESLKIRLFQESSNLLPYRVFVI
jgi:hypothetical protein